MVFDETRIGRKIHEVVAEAFPICRSITGDGVRETLRLLSDIVPLEIHEVPTGTRVFDWTVPEEWNIRDAFVADESGRKVIDFKKNNLHLVGYSVPMDEWVTLEGLQEHLHSLPDQPEAIPYVTAYYKKTWGFCLSHEERLKLKEGRYRVVIDSSLGKGSLTYGQCVIPGESEEEVFLSTYICHPSMANNELSGPAVVSFIGQWLASQPRRYTYRLAFVPETIGAITYVSRNLKKLTEKVVAGFNVTCIGDDRSYSFIESRYGRSLADKVAANVLSFRHPGFIRYSFLDRGSDERQYCSPGVDLPLVTLARSKFSTFPEYHTSLDNLDFVTPEGLEGGYGFVRDCLQAIESNRTYKVTCCCEPRLGRWPYPVLRDRKSGDDVITMADFLAYADGTNDLIDISNIIGKPVWEIQPLIKKLMEAGLVKEV